MNNWSDNPIWRGAKINWLNTLFLTLTPVSAFTLVIIYMWNFGYTWFDFFIFLTMATLTGMSITAGYHRYFAHKTYECHWLIRFFYLVFGAAALQNSAYHWASDHRYHHRHVDKEGDPYNITRGFFWAHMGWIFFSNPPGRTYDNVKDLEKDALVVWQHKYYWLIGILACFALPALIGLFFNRPMGGFIWGGLFRVVFNHHGTFLINSAAHKFGKQTYSKENTARDFWLLALLTYGEGYHNFHHAFASDYRNGVRWFHYDPSKWFIWTLSRVGLASRLQRVPKKLYSTI